MHLPDDADRRPLETIDELVQLFVDAGKPPSAWRVGTEHEMIGVYREGAELGKAPPHGGPRGIAALLGALAESGRWAELREEGNLIALLRGRAQISLEPGGQLEMASEPLASTSELAEFLASYHAQLRAASEPLGLAWLAVGFRPFGTLAEVPHMPKGRYAVMRAYLPTRGRLAPEMMHRTATVQVNLDWSDPDDAAAKLRCAMSVTSILTALYAASPIVDGEVSGYQSYRARVWRETDPDRCGLLPFAFEAGDALRAYVEWALDVPMFFLHRRGVYQPAGGVTFRRFWREGIGGERATLADWELHLSTLFPEARLKRYLEIRGCDAGTLPMVLALGPLSRALLCDPTARDAAIALTADFDLAARQELWREVPRSGLATPIGGGDRTLGDLARELVAIAADGLRRIAPDEVAALEPVQAVAESGRTQADEILAVWEAAQGEPGKVIAGLRHF